MEEYTRLLDCNQNSGFKNDFKDQITQKANQSSVVILLCEASRNMGNHRVIIYAIFEKRYEIITTDLRCSFFMLFRLYQRLSSLVFSLSLILLKLAHSVIVLINRAIKSSHQWSKFVKIWNYC